jgi:hypothetical protein
MNGIEDVFSCRKPLDRDDRMLANSNYDRLNIEIYHRINPRYNKIAD